MKTLTLIPTPLDDQAMLEPEALTLLKNVALDEQVLLLVEEHKVARNKWLKWGLPRESIERFVLFNEHSAEKLESELVKEFKNGKRAVLMSDGGLPAFCDPGQKLIDRLHREGLTVTCTPFANSVALAIALCGFEHRQFVFQGFLPQKDPSRSVALKNVWGERRTQVLMETPYRRQKFLEELRETRPQNQINRNVFIALELGRSTECLYRGTVEHLLGKTRELDKLEFVLVIDSDPSN